jgi:hypothetical protein
LGTDQVKAFGSSLFIGTAGSGVKAKYNGGIYKVSNTSTTWTSTILPFSNDSVCWFTKLGGGLRNPGDQVTIYDLGDGRWRLGAKSAGGGNKVEAEARCFARQQ